MYKDRESLNVNGLGPLAIEEFIQVENDATGSNVKYNELTSEEVYRYYSDWIVTFGNPIQEVFLHS